MNKENKNNAPLLDKSSWIAIACATASFVIISCLLINHSNKMRDKFAKNPPATKTIQKKSNDSINTYKARIQDFQNENQR
jgi:hypothetical protein